MNHQGAALNNLFHSKAQIEEISPLGLVNAGTNNNAGRRSCRNLIGPCLNQTKGETSSLQVGALENTEDSNKKKTCSIFQSTTDDFRDRL